MKNYAGYPIAELQPRERPLKKAADTDLPIAIAHIYADFQCLALAAKGAHWNVTGPDFFQYHQLFDRIYDEVAAAIDPIAEHLRYLGMPVPVKLEELEQLSVIPIPDTFTMPPDALVALLLQGHLLLESRLTEAYQIANSANTQGIVNMLANELERTGTRIYLLRSTSSN
ncbi:MAG TPA: ferritin-like domain-containing protein [Coleofasciculaceae cyanobacterium]